MGRTKARANGQGDPYRVAEGGWRMGYYVELPNGERRRRYVRGRTKQEAWQKAQAAVLRGDTPAMDRAVGTVDAWLDEWLASKRGNIAGTTWAEYERQLRLYVRPLVGTLKLNDLTSLDVGRLLGAMGERGLSPQTRRHVWNRLHAAMETAVEVGHLRHNPVKRESRPPVREQTPGTLTDAEVGRILNAMEGEALRPLFILAARTGLRQGELLGLRWEDIEPTSNVDLPAILRVRQTLRRDRTFAEPKSEAGRRDIPLPADLFDILTEHRANQARQRAAAGGRWVDRGLVFSNDRGMPLVHRSVSGAWGRVCDRAEVANNKRGRRGMHSLRRCFANSLVHGGVPVPTAQALMGHSTPDLTLRVYTSVDPDHLADAMKLSGEAWARSAAPRA